MITVSECAAFAGLASNELVLGAVPSVKHHSLLSGYLSNLGRGPQAVRDMIVADLRMFLELGATRRVADLLLVLRLFLSDFPAARRSTSVAATRAGEQPALSKFGRVSRAGEREGGVVVALSSKRPAHRSVLRGAAGSTDPVAARRGPRVSSLRRES
jgi:hypothetical protein